MSFCTSSLSSFCRIIDAEHSFIPQNADAVQGLHIPGACPLHPAPPPYENNTSTINVGAPDEPTTDMQDGGLADFHGTDPERELAPPVLLANPATNHANAGIHADQPAAGVEARIKQNTIAGIVVVFNRRLLYFRVVIKGWFSRVIRHRAPQDKAPPFH